jgi:hypothetical protein
MLNISTNIKLLQRASAVAGDQGGATAAGVKPAAYETSTTGARGLSMAAGLSVIDLYTASVIG